MSSEAVFTFVFFSNLGIVVVNYMVDAMKQSNLFQNHHELAQKILEHIADLVSVINLRGQYLYLSPSHVNIVGYTPDELIGKSAIHFFHPDDRTELRRKLVACATQGKNQRSTARFRHKDGHWVYLEGHGTPIFNTLHLPEMILVTSRDITEERQLREKIEYLALHDALTQLPNRTLFYDRLSQALKASRRTNQLGGVVMIDLDYFKTINDTYGHLAGDQLLQGTGHRLQEALRKEDTIARFGGDEFVVLIPKLKQAGDLVRIMKKLNQAMHQPCTLNGKDVPITITQGGALFPAHGKDAIHLLHAADIALYAAKAQGRNTHQIFTPDLLEA
jgi:diguanylate cyclase (GGDEF)-like protein/PAS domain S-box-containing protein